MRKLLTMFGVMVISTSFVYANSSSSHKSKTINISKNDMEVINTLEKKNTRLEHYQDGVASFYGARWNGRKTANGEIFNTSKLTAAHKNLPFGTLVKVTNEANGKSVIVRINDRGPYVKGRVIDLTRAAFETISSVNKGIAKVKIEVIK